MSNNTSPPNNIVVVVGPNSWAVYVHWHLSYHQYISSVHLYQHCYKTQNYIYLKTKCQPIGHRYE